MISVIKVKRRNNIRCLADNLPTEKPTILDSSLHKARGSPHLPDMMKMEDCSQRNNKSRVLYRLHKRAQCEDCTSSGDVLSGEWTNRTERERQIVR